MTEPEHDLQRIWAVLCSHLTWAFVPEAATIENILDAIRILAERGSDHAD